MGHDPPGSTFSEIFLVYTVDLFGPCGSTSGVLLVVWSLAPSVSAWFWTFGICPELTSSDWEDLLGFDPFFWVLSHPVLFCQRYFWVEFLFSCLSGLFRG